MKNHPTVSVIIPVFNTASYLTQCLHSVMNQDLENIEIIIVNDASTDDSLVRCMEFAKRDKRIKIINKIKNEGLYLARKTGIENATGVYICHVDSDDWLVKGALKKMTTLALEHDIDILVGNYYRVLDKYSIVKQKGNAGAIPKNIPISQLEFMERYYAGFFGVNIFSINMWGRIYKKSFIDQIYMKNLDQGFGLAEDLPYNIQVFPEAKSIYFMSDFVYYYRFGGSTSKFNKMHMSSSLKMYDLKREMIVKYEFEKMIPYIIHELKNCLKSYIEMLVKYKPYSIEGALLDINKFATTIQFDEVITFYQKEESSDVFIKALIQKNYHKMYELVELDYKKKKFTNFAKYLIFKVLN